MFASSRCRRFANRSRWPEPASRRRWRFAARDCPRPLRLTSPHIARWRWSPSRRWQRDFPRLSQIAPSPAPAAPDRAQICRPGSSRLTDLAGCHAVNCGQAIPQRRPRPRNAAGVAAHLPGIGVVSELPEIAPHRRHRKIAGKKSRQGQHRMAIAPRRAQQNRRKHETGVEFEYAPRFGEQQAETRRTKPARRQRFAALRRRGYLLKRHGYFLSPPRVPPRPAMVTNISLNCSAIFGLNVNQLCISAFGVNFSMFLF